MATSPYLNKAVKGEQDLYEDIVIESLKFYGQDVYYLPREIVNKDKVLLDDVSSRFSDAYKIEMYIENTEGFDGEGDLFTKFGVEIRDAATFIVSRKRWQQLIGTRLTEANFRPREGDVIFLPLSNSLFQIMKTETETPFFQLSNLPTFRMRCELFEYNDEDFDTGVETIDFVEYEAAYQYALTMDSASLGYTIGEEVHQVVNDAFGNYTYTMKGDVTDWSDSDLILQVAHVGSTDGKFRTWRTDTQIAGQESAALGTPTLVQQLQEIQESAQNKIFDDFEGDFLDFSETNPFGDVQ